MHELVQNFVGIILSGKIFQKDHTFLSKCEFKVSKVEKLFQSSGLKPIAKERADILLLGNIQVLPSTCKQKNEEP